MTSVDGSHSGLSQLGICVLAMVHKHLGRKQYVPTAGTYILQAIINLYQECIVAT